VLYGARAVAFPLLSRRLTLRRGLDSEAPQAPALVEALLRARQAVARFRSSRPSSGIHLAVESNIPPEQGLGSSASLSVAVAQWEAQRLRRQGVRLPRSAS